MHHAKEKLFIIVFVGFSRLLCTSILRLFSQILEYYCLASYSSLFLTGTFAADHVLIVT